MAATAQQQTASGLRRDAIGLREVLFQSITDMAPGAAIAASIPAGVAFAGGAPPRPVVFPLGAFPLCPWARGLPSPSVPPAGCLARHRRPRAPPGPASPDPW